MTLMSLAFFRVVNDIGNMKKRLLPCPLFRGDSACECELGFQKYCDVKVPCEVTRKKVLAFAEKASDKDKVIERS